MITEEGATEKDIKRLNRIVKRILAKTYAKGFATGSKCTKCGMNKGECQDEGQETKE